MSRWRKGARKGWFLSLPAALAMMITSSCAMKDARRNLSPEALAGEVIMGAPADRPVFIRTAWYERGPEFHNPFYDRRFRVSDPGVVLHPTFGRRPEARANGMMLIRAEEDLSLLDGAELYLELWGGHPGTAAKRVTVNGRSTYAIPEVGTAAGHCTHQYPAIPLKVTDLVNGYDALQFACDKGTSFWGHFIVDNACLRLALKDSHPALAAAGLASFKATVRAVPLIDGSGKVLLGLDCDEAAAARIAAVEYHGFYEGYDENGDGHSLDWHGFTTAREPVAVLGSAESPPFGTAWDASMLPRQQGVRLHAVVRFREPDGLLYRTRIETLHDMPPVAGRASIHYSEDMPRAFWSRIKQEKTCTIVLPMDPKRVERAQLHVVIWDGGRGTVEHPFVLNGTPLDVAGKGLHDVLYRVVEIDPAILKKGPNIIRLLSDTEHHGIEVLLPGPALVIRERE